MMLGWVVLTSHCSSTSLSVLVLLAKLSREGELGSSLVKRPLLLSELRSVRVSRRSQLLGRSNVAEGSSDGEDVGVVTATGANRVRDVGLRLVVVSEEEVRRRVRRQDWWSAASGQLVQLLVEVVGLVQGAGTLGVSIVRGEL